MPLPEPSLKALKEAIENQWCIQRYHLEATDRSTDEYSTYYQGAVDALEEAMVEFDQEWVARLRSKATKS